MAWVAVAGAEIAGLIIRRFSLSNFYGVKSGGGVTMMVTAVVTRCKLDILDFTLYYNSGSVKDTDP